MTHALPKEEIYGLTSQVRRCAVSISSNIAKGNRRNGDKESRHFLTIAFGSGAELETQIEISKRTEYIQQDEFAHLDEILDEVMRILNVMIHKR